ncbi:MAG: roadblock/LC7 domain-containing protein [Candidatus Hodarchaeales archaeon]
MAKPIQGLEIVDEDVGHKLSRIEDLLFKIRLRVPDIQGLVVVTKDGLPVASLLVDGVDEDRISAMTAGSLSLAERVASELYRGDLGEMIIKGTKGLVVIMDAGEEAVLTGIVSSEAKLGLVLLEMKRVAKTLASIL